MVMEKKLTWLIVFILVVGVGYRLMLTSGGNFIFHMDSARDLVDVREMVMSGKLRLIGPTSAVEGFYTGPAWYYLLAVPFILTGGDPYGAILLEILAWVIGGFFLLKLVSRWGVLAVVTTGNLWVASNFVVLQTLYSFHPNLITLFTPLFIFLLEKYLMTGKLIYSLGVGFWGGLFFNFEMNFGVFIPLIIVLSIIFSKKLTLLKTANFLLGAVCFTLFLLPQVIFDLRHEFIMSRSILRYLTEISSTGASINLLGRVPLMVEKFYNILLPTFMNNKLLVNILMGLLLVTVVKLKRTEKIAHNILLLILLLFIFVPLLGYILIPVTVNSWHLGGVVAVSLLLAGFVVKKTSELGILGKILAGILTIFVVLLSFNNIGDYFRDRNRPSGDPSLFRNEVAAIDYVYQQAQGQNFKVYTYLPSVYDYPYQYLFWWYGKKKYGYIPYEYAYSPNKPQYISHKDKFSGNAENYSGLVFLIKEPDQIKMRQAWENEFKDLLLLSKEMVGPLEVEVRREFTQK